MDAISLVIDFASLVVDLWEKRVAIFKAAVPVLCILAVFVMAAIIWFRF